MTQEILDSFEYHTEQEWRDLLWDRVQRAGSHVLARKQLSYLVHSSKLHHETWESMGLVIPESMLNRIHAAQTLLSEMA